jgi:drug/metabolite transporter (DMT)-like permease
MLRGRTGGLAAGLVAAAIWGGMYVVSKWTLNVIPPFTLIVLRLALGVIGLAPALLLTGGFRARWPSVGRVVAVGAIGYGLSLGLQFVGTRWTTAANAALVTSASPVFMILFGAWFLKEQITVARLTGLTAGTAGVLATLDPGDAQWGTDFTLGDLALVGAAVTWALYSVLVRWVSRDLPTLHVSLLAFLGGLPVALPLAGLELGRGLPPMTPAVLLGVAYLGLVSTALAMYLWNRSLALLEAGAVSFLVFAQPVVGIALGAWLLHERPGGSFWLGAALIAVGLFLGAGGWAPRVRLKGA